MCGISGFLNFNQKLIKNDLISYANEMNNSLRMRGPDFSDFWLEKNINLVLCHTRLSIIDLDKRANQPMISKNNRFVIILNGEIYNFLSIKKDLIKLGISFRTQGDTEVLLEAISHFGIEKSLKLIEGMFSFVLWDKYEKKIILVRDRLGIKPLYYYFDKVTFAFASEIKAIRRLDWLDFSLDRKSITSYVRLNYIPAPNSIYKNIRKVLPGEMITVNLEKNIKKRKYWSFQKLRPFDKKDVKIDYENKLHDLLRKKIKSHLIADVPVGVFLSGGVDSSLITSITNEVSEKKIDTFTIGFENSSFDEAKYAREVSRHLGTNHNEVYFSNNVFLDLIEKISDVYDEPFADSSQLPTLLLSQITRKKVKVAISGDGADELFGGYYRYFMANRFNKLILDSPVFFKNLIFIIITKTPKWVWENIGRILSKKYGKRQFADKLLKLSNVIKDSDENLFYFRLISNINNPEDCVLNKNERSFIIFDSIIQREFPNFIERMQLIDTLKYLPDDILTKVDRASMYYSLEVRVPFLDHEIGEFSKKIPLNMKIQNGKGKIILKKILKNYLPDKLVEREKMGFGIPLNFLIEKKLSNYIESLLYSKEIQNQEIFDINFYKTKWNEHKTKKRDWKFLFWNFFVFQKWFSRWNSVG